MKNTIKIMLLFIVFTLVSCQSILKSVIKNSMQDTQDQQAELLKSDNMHVFLIGSGGPLSNEERISAGIGVIAGGEFILVDIGPGAVRNINILGLPAGSLSALFLTHFHSDHISDLGELGFMTWAQGRQGKLKVYGPEGVEQVVNGYNMAYALDSSYRTAHHGEKVMPSKNAGAIPITLSIPDPEEAMPFFNRNGLKASVFLVDHFPAKPAVGYRFEYKGNSVVITGDTVKTRTLPKFAKNADLLISEALDVKTIDLMSTIAEELNNPRLSKQMTDIMDYHMTPVQAAEVAQEARAKKLVYVHIVPPILNFFIKRMYLEGTVDAFDGDIILGEDGMAFELEPKN
ncbi:MAG: MBL fold metallo-hydrolase [Deltaproteobacteria bacterium]|nr:MBL fold metallo-hydrolase [Deltaproteobacteria bacterium]